MIHLLNHEIYPYHFRYLFQLQIVIPIYRLVYTDRFQLIYDDRLVPYLFDSLKLFDFF